jgi:sugar phosphate isomerase/epimerase
MTDLELTLWPACVRVHSLSAQIEAAAKAGFPFLAVNSATYKAAISTGLSSSDILKIAEDHNVRFKWVDAVTGWLPIRYPTHSPELKSFLDFDLDVAFEIAGEFGADGLLAIGCFELGSIPFAKQAERFEALCRRAQSHNLRVGLEFIPMWGIPDLRAALQLVTTVNAPNGGLVLDTWHFFRSEPDYGLLEEISNGLLFAVQIADASRSISGAGLLEDCLNFRRLPGRGELPLPELLGLLEITDVCDFGPEVFSMELDRLPAQEAAALCAHSTEAILSLALAIGNGAHRDALN